MTGFIYKTINKNNYDMKDNRKRLNYRPMSLNKHIQAHKKFAAVQSSLTLDSNVTLQKQQKA